MVEVDSTYYALPERATAELWVQRTPAVFSFHVKAYGLLTGQPAEVSRMPRALIEALPRKLAGAQRLYAKDLPPELLNGVWDYFLDALEPLYDAGKLGGILLQFPRWFLPTPESKDLLAECAMRLANVPAMAFAEVGGGRVETNAYGVRRAGTIGDHAGRQAAQDMQAEHRVHRPPLEESVLDHRRTAGHDFFGRLKNESNGTVEVARPGEVFTCRQ